MDSPLVTTAELGVAAFAGVDAARSAVPALRKKLINEFSVPLGLVKYAEEQTIVSLAAVLKAIADFGLQDQVLTDWGVVSGPRFLGREQLARQLDKFKNQGALGASPLTPAYLSLHAVSGTISLALHIHGPNLGVGGSNGNLPEALLTGLAMQQEQSLPGVWITMSEWEPEPIPYAAAQQPEPVCRAVSLALTPAMVNASGFTFRLLPDEDNQGCPPPSIAELAQFLTSSFDVNRPSKWICPLAGNGRLELVSSGMAQTSARPARAA